MEAEVDKRLFEETKKRLQQILEYTVINGNNIDEADDDNEEQGGDEQPPMNGGGGVPVPDGMSMDDGGQGGTPMPIQGQGMNQSPIGPDAGIPQQGVNGPEGFDPQIGDAAQPTMDDMGQEPTGDEPSEDDDVVDITDLTDKQDETEKDIEKLGNKFSEVLGHLKAFEKYITDNDKKIEDLKAEFEKRNPTQIEKLSMQTTKSYPFNVTPEQYWKEKEATSNYRTEDDDNGKEQGQYVITANDVNGDTNWRAIADSLDDDDFIYNQTLSNAMKL
jgi:hypothetical protein